jgi:hypothetical protein
VKEAKANQLVHHNGLFKMKEDEDIENMDSRFQALVYGIQVLKKSYVEPDHVKKILSCFSARFRQKVTAIQEVKALDKLCLENLISSLKSHEIELEGDEPNNLSKSVAVTSKEKTAKSLQSAKSEEKDSDDEAEFQEMAYLTKRFQYLTKKKIFPSRSSDSKTSSFKDRRDSQKGCLNYGKTGHSIAYSLRNKRENKEREALKRTSTGESLRKASWQPGRCLMKIQTLRTTKRKLI